MSFWRVILSRISGRHPGINQLDHEAIVKNLRTGSLYVLKESETGVKEVIEITGGVPGSGGGSILKTEILIGQVNGINRVFSTSSPYVTLRINVFKNGLKEIYFVESSDTSVTLDEPPLSNGFSDKIEALYILKS
ncbi:MAG: hypothetical protein V1775_00490 [Bacteroidota bacterium]